MSQEENSTAVSLENEIQTPNKMENVEDQATNEQTRFPFNAEAKPTPALVKRKKFKDLFQSPSDSLVSPMSRTLSGKTQALLLKQKPRPKRLNSLKVEAEGSSNESMQKN